MSVNLIRKNSDTPNIRNYDDARLFRYINQNRSGIIKDYGNELAMTHGTGNNLHIASGEIIHQGWQVEITAAGVDIELENRDSVEYYSVYLEINLAIASQQKAEIKYLKGNEAYPVIDTGDDLTTTPTGTSRLLIAKVYLVPGSSIFTINRQIDVIPYYPAYAVDATYAEYASRDTSKGTIEERLNNLGFKSGSLELSGSGYSSITSPTNSLLKQGQMVRCDLAIEITDSNTNFNLLINIPNNFKPIYSQKITIEIIVDVNIRQRADIDGHVDAETAYFENVKIFNNSNITNTGLIEITYNDIETILDNMYNDYGGDIDMWVSSISIKNVSIYTGWRLNDRILPPSYISIYSYEESGYNYYDIQITNPNNSNGILYFKKSTESSYSSYQISANSSILLANFIEGSSGEMYLVINSFTSDIINWNV